MDQLAAHHERIRRRGVNAPVYWVVQAAPLLADVLRREGAPAGAAARLAAMVGGSPSRDERVSQLRSGSAEPASRAA